MGCCDDKTPMPYPVGRYVPWFAGWTEFTPTVPKMYWDVKSQEQRIKTLCMQVHKLVCYADMLGDKIGLNRKDIDELQAQFQKFMESGFDDYYAEQIEKWVNDHLEDLYRLLVKQVFFGLTMDGRFCAYIPESWSDITFDTGAVFGRTDYGRLILRFDSEGAIDNTYSYSLAQPTQVEQLIADLETDAKRTDAAFETLFKNLNIEVVHNGNI